MKTAMLKSTSGIVSQLILLLIVVLAQTTVAQVVVDYPQRRFGTNIFDFSPVMQRVQQGATNTPYLITGEVFDADGSSAQVVRKKISVRINRAFQRQLLLAGPGELLQMLQVSQMVQRKGGVSAGEFYSMSPSIRQMYMDATEQVVDYVRVLVTNCPPVYLVPGKQVRLFAMPTGTYSYTDSAGRQQTIPCYNYGQPLVGQTTISTNVYLVTDRGFVRKETPEEIAAKKALATTKFIAWQHEQASNGVAHVQYDLAKRYLDGNGLQKNDTLGRYWLERSATQDYEPACTLLQKLANQ